MKTKLGLLAAAILVCAVLTANVAGAQQVQFWSWWSVDDEDLAKMSEYVGAEVVHTEHPFGEFADKLVVSVAGGTPPDLIYVDTQWFDDFAQAGALTNLSPYVERNSTGIAFDDIFPAGLDMWRSGGKQLALPASVSPHVWWYNGTMFTELGLPPLDDSFDWDQWFSYSNKASRDTNADGLDESKGVMPWWFDVVTLIWGNGGELFQNGQLAVDSDATREALIYYKQFWDQDLIVNWNELAHLGFEQHPDLAWQAGVVAFAPGGDWIGPVTVRDGETGEWRFDVGVAHAPLSPIGERSGLLRGNGLSIPTGAPNPEGGWKLISYILDDENQAKGARDGQLPARISIARSDYLVGDYPYSKDVLIEAMSYQRSSDKGVLWSQTYAIWNSPIKDGISKYVTGEQGLQAMIENLEQVVPPMLEEAR